MVAMEKERSVSRDSFLGQLLFDAKKHVASQDHKYESSRLLEGPRVYISCSVLKEKDVDFGN